MGLQLSALRVGPWQFSVALRSAAVQRSVAVALGRASRWRRALQLLRQLPQRRVRVTAAERSSALGSWRQALQVEDEVMLTISALRMGFKGT